MPHSSILATALVALAITGIAALLSRAGKKERRWIVAAPPILESGIDPDWFHDPRYCVANQIATLRRIERRRAVNRRRERGRAHAGD